MSYKTKVAAPLWTLAGNKDGTIPAGTVIELDGTPHDNIREGLILYRIKLPIAYQGKYIELRFLTVYIPPVTDPDGEAQPVHPPLESWLVQEGDGQMPALQMVDASFEVRPSPLPETNMTFPDRPIAATGQVSPNGKIITNIINSPWRQWITESIGERNAQNFASPGDGYCDTGPWKLMSATAGGNLRNVIKHFQQGGTKWCELDLLVFRSTPERRADGWYYRNELMTYRSHPQYFNVRTNRKATNQRTWLTAGGINIANDVGPIGGKGHEAWPAVANKRAAQRLLDMWHYPTLPANMIVYAGSLIIDGVRVERNEGITCKITKYRFHGPDVYGYDDIRDAWYKLSEMLVRGTLANRDGGNGFDWRCYTPCLIPNRRTCPCPDCGWLRP